VIGLDTQPSRIFYSPYPSSLSPLDLSGKCVNNDATFITTVKSNNIESYGYSYLRYVGKKK
jgi:hypothetical protein